MGEHYRIESAAAGALQLAVDDDKRYDDNFGEFMVTINLRRK